MNVQSLYDDCLDDYVKLLMDTDVLFRRIFHQDFELSNLSMEEQLNAEKMYQTKFPNGILEQPTLRDFLNYWKKKQHPLDINTNEDAPLFDTRLKRIVHSTTTFIPPASKRGRPEEFKPDEFIVRKTNNHEVYPLDLNQLNDDDVILDMSFEERTLMENKADHALREIAIIVETLNQLYDYKVLEINNERIM